MKGLLPVKRSAAILSLAALLLLVNACVVYPDGAVGPAPGAGDGLAEAGVAAADIGLATAAPGGFWGGLGGGWWGGGSSYEQNNYYNYNGRRHGYHDGQYRHRGYGAYRGGGFRGGGRR